MNYLIVVVSIAMSMEQADAVIPTEVVFTSVTECKEIASLWNEASTERKEGQMAICVEQK